MTTTERLRLAVDIVLALSIDGKTKYDLLLHLEEAISNIESNSKSPEQTIGYDRGRGY